MGGTEERGGREEGEEEGEGGGEVITQMTPNPGQSRLYRYTDHSKPAGASNVIISDS